MHTITAPSLDKLINLIMEITQNFENLVFNEMPD